LTSNSNHQLSLWFESIIKQKDKLARFYGDHSLLEETLAIQEIQRIIAPLATLSFNLPLYFEVDLAEEKPKEKSSSEKQHPSTSSTLDVLSGVTFETFGKLKDSGSNLVSNIAGTVWKVAPTVNLFGDFFSGAPKEVPRLLSPHSKHHTYKKKNFSV
jgi:hypothetical protein